MNKRSLIFLSAAMVIVGCSRIDFTNPTDYAIAVANCKSLSSSLNLDFISISAQVIPSELQALADKKRKLITRDELLSTAKFYDQSLSIIVEINPLSEGEINRNDLLTVGIVSYEEYKARLLELSFDLKRCFSLIIDGQEYEPVLANLENTYGLTSGRKIQLVFPVSYQSTNGDLNLKYTDYNFLTGIHRLNFNLNKNDIPNINLDQIIIDETK